MSYLNHQKNHARQLLGLALATAVLTSLFAVTSYSRTRSRFVPTPTTAALEQPGSSAGATSSPSGQVSPQSLDIWSSNGPVGLAVSLLAIDPANPDTTYAGAWSGLFKRTNVGGSWSRLASGLPRPYISALAIDPSNPATVYVGVDSPNVVLHDDCVYKSTNGGESWSLSSTGLGSGSSVYSLAIDPRDSNVIYASTPSGVFSSTNGGGNWSALGTLPDESLFFSLVIDPSNSQTIYGAVLYDCGNPFEYCMTIFKSTDGAVSWNRSGLSPLFYVSAPVIDPINPATLYLSGYADGGASRIYKSTDAGGTWSAIGTGLPDYYVSSLVIDPVNSNILYAGISGRGVFKSADGGASWNPLNDGLTDLNVLTLAIDSSGNFLHAGTYAAGVFDYQFSRAANPIDDSQSFVRQLYRDFLNREPDAGGLAYWTNEITKCGTDARCIHLSRIGVSGAFFVEPEFQETGYFVDRLHQASFGHHPTFAQFSADRAHVTVGPNLEASKQTLTADWVERPAFKDAYSVIMSPEEFVNKLFDTANLRPYTTERQQLATDMRNGKPRAQVLHEVIEIAEFKTRQYNPAFVLMQYFGYLRRDVDQGGYDFWLNVLNNRELNNYPGMICSFITSTEYQLRFGSTVTRSNADCGQ